MKIVNIILCMVLCFSTITCRSYEDSTALSDVPQSLMTAFESAKIVNNFFVFIKNDDIDGVLSLMGNTYIEEKGIDWLKRYLNNEIFPFFKNQKCLMTNNIMYIIDSLGRNGRGFYTYSVDFQDNRRPIAIFVAFENNELYLSDIILNEYFKGFHISEKSMEAFGAAIIYPKEDGSYFDIPGED